MVMSAKERQQKHRDRLRSQGKKQLLVTLEAKAFSALEKICKKNGFSHNQGINDALVQAVAGVKARETDKQIKTRMKAETALKKVEAEKIKLEKELAETLIAMRKQGMKLTVMKPDEDGVYKPNVT